MRRSTIFGGNAATLIVTTVNDSGPGSLRQALADAHDGDTIQFDPTLNGQTITLTSAELTIAKNITIHGPGSNLLTVSRNSQAPAFRIFQVLFSHTVIIQGLTISGGLNFGGGILNGGSLSIMSCIIRDNVAPTVGGGILNSHTNGGATLTITDSTITANRADTGGGISSDEPLTIAHSTISDNIAFVTAGGIFSGGNIGLHAPVIITDSIISNNQSGNGGMNDGDAGGIRHDGDGVMSIQNSTITNNTTNGIGLTKGGGILSSERLEVINSAIAGNMAGYEGGGIASSGPLTISHSSITGNTAFSLGGGISNHGVSPSNAVTDSSISGNHLGNSVWSTFGGGVYNDGSMTITNSTVSDNMNNGQMTGTGGGIYNIGDGQHGSLALINSTISHNFALGDGGAISNTGTLTVAYSTFSGNSTQNGQGGGIATDGTNATMQIGNTILNAGTLGANILNNGGTITSHGYNLSSDNSGGFLTGPGDQINTNPMLGPLQNNGGPTLTHELLSGSPAINAGDPAFTPPPDFDQRGPGFPRLFAGRIDIGSLEVQPGPTPSPTPSATPSPTPTPTAGTPTPTPTVTPTPTATFTPTPTPVNGKIVFVSNRDGQSEIYVMDANGANQTNLTNHLSNDTDPAWSPDGTKIAFSSDRESTGDIFVMDANGSNPIRLTDALGLDLQPSWSPDGTKIAFTSNRDGTSEIYVMDANGSNPVRLTNGPLDLNTQPSWSPDGTKIAFQSFISRDSQYEIFVMDANGANQTNLTNNLAADLEPRWSPDGTKIAFTTTRDNHDEEVYVMNANGSNPTRLTFPPAFLNRYPTWSPDGLKIAFTSDRDDNFEIYVMNVDGSEQTRLTTASARDGNPSWGILPPVGPSPTPTPTPTLVVTTTNDSGPGSLRQALADAHDGDIIGFDPVLNGQTIGLTSGELVINQSISILGPGSDLLRISPQGRFRIIHIMPGHTVAIRGLTISGGSIDKFDPAFSGAGILNEQGTLTVDSCIVSSNFSFYVAGGISNTGTLTVSDSTIIGNFGGFEAGGISNSGALTIMNSTVRNNTSGLPQGIGGGTGSGGGIYNYGTVTIVSSTIDHNTADGSNQGTGGGVYSGAGSLTISNSTISQNVAVARGGAIFVGAGSITNCTISGNSAAHGGGISVTGTLQIGNTILNANGANIRAAARLPRTATILVATMAPASSLDPATRSIPIHYSARFKRTAARPRRTSC